MADMTADMTSMVIAAARRAATDLGVGVSIAVVDAGANLTGFLRMDGAVLASVDTAQVKARTAARFGTATRNLPGMTPAALPMMAGVREPIGLFPGGIPIRIAGQIVGAVGVGGGTAEQDDAAASAAASITE